MIRWWGKLTEHTKELSYWEADPEGKLEKWLLLMIVDKFASVRTDGDRQMSAGLPLLLSMSL